MAKLLEGLDKNPCNDFTVREVGRNKKTCAMTLLLERLTKQENLCDDFTVREVGQNKKTFAMTLLLERLDETRKPLR